MQNIHLEFEQTPINPLTPTPFKGGLGCVWQQIPSAPDGLGVVADFYGGMAHADNSGTITAVPNAVPTAASMFWNDGQKLFVKPNFNFLTGKVVDPNLPTPTFFYLYGKTGNA